MDRKFTATVVRATGSWYDVLHDGETVRCRIRGRLRLKGVRSTNPVVVGDEVACEADEGGDYVIADILPRRNYVIRRASNLSKESHIIAANVDQALLMASLRSPETPTEFVDRFLVTCEAYKVPVTILLSKLDLQDAEAVAEFRAVYEGAGYRVLEVSVREGRGVEEVRELGMLNHANHVSLVTRDANMEGKGAIGLSQLICATLRMRPDRIVVGECRGGEIVDLLRALNSGHRGGMTTLHANQVTAVPSRLVALGLLAGLNPQATAALAQDAFDVVLHVGRVGGRRRIAQIGRLEFAEGKLRGNLLAGWNGNQMRASQQWPDFVRVWSR